MSLRVNVILFLAALVAIPALSQAVRVLISILAWFIAIGFVIVLGMVILLELASHGKLL